MSSNANNKRIAKNTIFLYFRQILIMAVSLYTVRVVLNALGEDDYGIYNVVGGFVSMFNIISGAMSLAISRFITYEMGKNETTIKRLQLIFSSSIIIQVIMGIFICILMGTLGVWFVENKMVIPNEKLGEALYVLMFSTVGFFISLLNVPYNALIIAHERMKAFAYISIIEAIFKLGIAFILTVSSYEKLILYAFLMTFVSLVIRSIYAFYCKKNFKECHFVKGFDKQLLSQMLSFSGWAFLGNATFILKEHGTNILLNIFCGPAVNAARGITSQVTNSVTMFVSNFMQAVNPQITKSYSSGNLVEMHSLIFKSSKFSFYLMLLLGLPLMKCTEYVLSIWLVSVPAHTVEFIQLLLIFCIMDCLVYPLITGLLAEGNIRTYEIVLLSLNIGNIIFSYFVLKYGFAPESVYIISIILEIGIIASRIWLSGKAYKLPVCNYCKDVVVKALIVSVITGAFAYFIFIPITNIWGYILLNSIIISLFTFFIIYIFGLNLNEKKITINFIRNKLCI